jgi:rhamnosyltransferase
MILESLPYHCETVKTLCVMALHIENDSRTALAMTEGRTDLSVVCDGTHIDMNQQRLIYSVAKHFDRVICVHDCLKNNFSNSEKVKYIYCPNDNNYLDFGKYYYYIKNLYAPSLSQIALINDSCYIVKDLSIFNDKYDCDVWGITDSIEITYHIQSYFLVYRTQKAIRSLFTFFDTFVVDSLKANFSKRDLVDVWEVGMSRYLLSQNLKLHSLYKYKKQYFNLSYCATDYLYSIGCPLIKKKNIHNKKYFEFKNSY